MLNQDQPFEKVVCKYNTIFLRVSQDFEKGGFYMEEVQKVTNQTPIEIALGIDENGMTTARALYDFLEMPNKNFSRWAKQNIEKNEFYEENKDWWGFFIVKSGNECKDYRLTTDFAKHLSMESHSAKGKIARKYFVGVEDKAKDLVLILKQASGDPMKLLKLHYAALEQVDKKVSDMGSKVETLEERFTKFEQELPMLPDDADEVHDCLNKRVVFLLGGKESNAYRNKSLSKKVFMDAYRVLKYNFNVSRYKAIKRKQKDKAIEVIQRYEPPFFLAQQIESVNAQQTLDLTGGGSE